jgi:hypothetical protein
MGRWREITTKIPEIIALAETYNLPVDYLRYVATNYGKFFTYPHDDDKTSYTDMISNEMVLKWSVFEQLENIDPQDFAPETASLATFYHEMTHAYLDLREEEFVIGKLIEQAEKYYKPEKPPFGGTRSIYEEGRKPQEISRPYQVVQEAAGTYVGHRIAAYWEALQSLYWLQNNYEKGVNPLALGGSFSKIERTYNAEMGRTVFGYEEGLFSGQVPVTKPIYPRLRMFCDMTILEGKIPDKFSDLVRIGDSQNNRFKKLVEGITKTCQ